MNGIRKALFPALSLLLVLALLPISVIASALTLSNEYRLTTSGGYVYNLPEKTTVNDLLSTVYSTAQVLDANGNTVSGDTLVGTGMILSYPAASYIVVVYGDVNGDGVITTVDYLLCKMCITYANLEGAYLKAADIDGDGLISGTDCVAISSHISRKCSLFVDSYLTDEEKASVVIGEPTGVEFDNTATIHFDGDTITTTGEGVTVVDNYAYVTAAGEYTVTGASDNGYVHVAAATTDHVMLRLSGVQLTNTSGSAIYFEQCKKAYIELVDGTSTVLADGTATTLTDKGAVFANDTLVISGNGSLTVTGNRQHGIASDDDIIISSGSITVANAVKDAFHANDDITVNGGTVTVSAAGSDAMESEATLNINGGTVNLTAATGNALKAATVFTATDGMVTVASSENAIKGDAEVNISGGTFTLNSTNNAIKSDLLVNISGGEISINSTGDGIKSYSVDATSAGEQRTSFAYTALDGSVDAVGTYVWTTGSVSASAVYWYAVVATSNGLGGYTVSDVYAYGESKTFTVPTDGIAVLSHVSADAYASACLIQKGDTITYNTASATVTVTTPGNYLGNVNIIGGNLYAVTATDAIQAGEDIYVNNTSTALTSSSGIGTGAYNMYIISAGGASAAFDSTAGSYKALKADDSITLDFVKLYASSPEDTIRSDGDIAVNGGAITVYSGRDGIAAVNALNISGGGINVTTGGGYSQTISSTDTNSYKALKGTGSINISGGMFALNSRDDAVHSNGACTVSDGEFGIYTGDDAFHSDTTMTISGGDITVSASYEGVEGLNVEVSGGTVRVTSSDDGMNAAGGADGSGTSTPTRPGMGGSMGDTSKYSLALTGDAFVWVNAGGDGLDSNGSLTISGGTVIVQQSGGGNSGFDADGTRLINGGIVVVVDGGDMVELPATSSAQCSISYKMSSSVSAGSLLCVTNSSGAVLFAYKSTVSYKHILVSCPDFSTGSSYNIYTGGSITGSANEGLYEGGTYTGGTLKKTVTLSSKVTSTS